MTNGRRPLLALDTLLCLVCLVPVGCSKKSDGHAQSAALASASAAPAALPSASDPPGRGGESLFGQLAKEAANRPKIAPNADDAFVAFERVGVKVGERQQTLGSTYKAMYCMGGYTTAKDLAINLCEYPSEPAASAGRDLSKSVFPALTTRESWAHKSLVLTIIQVKVGEPAKAMQKKVVDAFSAL